MKKLKMIIISIIVIIIIISIIIAIMRISLNKNEIDGEIEKRVREEREQYIDIMENPIYLKQGQSPDKVRNPSVFFSIDASIQKYIGYVVNKDNEAILNILDKQYIAENNINNSNILNFIDNYSSEYNYETKLMYQLVGQQYSTYYVKALINNKLTYFIVNTDIASQAFSIIQISEGNFKDKVNETVKEDITTEETIELNEYNKIENRTFYDEDICRKYQKYFTKLELNNPEEAYELLDTEYREKRFSSIEDFKKYIEENKEAIEKAVLSGYSRDYGEEVTKYVLQDSYNNYFIIEEDSIMNFTIKLDSYTVPESDFKTEYGKLKEAEKASANLGIFMQMINTKDYTHAYEKLSEGFKENYFKTLEEFENYIKSNFYYVNDYTIDNYKNEGNIYIYHITLKNHNKVRDDTNIQKTFNIRLGEGTDFEISFNVN